MPASTKVELFTGNVSALGRRMAVLRLTPGKTSRPEFSHTALILDCSASMTGSLESVKKDVQRFVSKLDEKDYVSLIIFSGHDTYELISGPTRCDATGRALLDKAIRERVRILNLTVFSEPLEKVLRHLRQNQIAGMVSQAVLFTDGCAVPTYWSVQKEENLALAAARALYEAGIAVSVIGYGYYYDEPFATKLMAAGGWSGIFRHMNDVTDFGEVINDIRDTFNRIDTTDITLDIGLGTGEVTAVYRALPEVVRLSSNRIVKSRGLFDGSVTYYLDVSHAFDVAHIRTTINGEEKLLGPDAMPLTPELEAECVRITAVHMILSGDTRGAAELLLQTGDDDVADRVSEAYTERERRTNCDRSRRAFRNKGWIGSGFKKQGPNRCVANFMRILSGDPTVRISFPRGGYQRIGEKVIDPRIVRSPLGDVLTVTRCVSNETRLNLSFGGTIQVERFPLHDDGSINFNGPLETVIMDRTFCVVQDGELNITQLLVSSTEHTFNELQAAEIVDATATWKPGKSYLVDLTDMKMVSSAWAQPNRFGLGDLMRQEAELSAKYTAVNRQRTALKPVGYDQRDITESGRHKQKGEKDPDAVVEYYTASCVELRFMGKKPKPEDFATWASQFKTFDEAHAARSEVTKQLEWLRWEIYTIRFACHKAGWGSVNWGAPNTTQQGKWPKQERLATVNGSQLKLVTWNEKFPFS